MGWDDQVEPKTAVSAYAGGRCRQEIRKPYAWVYYGYFQLMMRVCIYVYIMYIYYNILQFNIILLN